MTSPNINANPQSVADDLGGINGDGSMRPYRKAAYFYEAHIFGLPKDYAFPQGSNVGSAVGDHTTTLAKLLARKRTLADHNQYDAWDALMTIAKYIVQQNPHINDDEPLSVNYKKTS